MLSVNIRFNTTKAINGLEKSVDQLVGLISQDLFKTIKRKTPKKTGRARQGWNLKKQGKGFDVKNTVPYIDRKSTRLNSSHRQQHRKPCSA